MTLRHFALPLALSPLLLLSGVAVVLLPGTMTLADLKAYRPKATEAVCRPYKVYVVCVPPAPSGGEARGRAGAGRAPARRANPAPPAAGQRASASP